MKKILFVLAALLVAPLGFAQEATISSKYISDSGVKPVVKSVMNAEDLLISGYSITYEYPVKDIENAVLERLAKEGLVAVKKKNTYGFKGIKYNLLWPRNFDLYINFMGSPNSGTINVLLSQGYDNFIVPDQDKETTDKVFKWLTQLDLDIQNYLYNHFMATHLEEKANIQKDLDELLKDRKSLEKKLKKVESNQKKLEVSRTIVTEGSPVDAKKVKKEEEKALKLQRQNVSLTADIEALNVKIDEIKGDLDKKNAAIQELQDAKPRSND